MTSTTSCFLPAAARAGTPAYSPEASTPRVSDTAEPRSFEELVSDEQHHDTPRAQSEPAEPTVDSRAPAEPDDLDVPRDDDDRDETPEDATVIGALATPSLLQTLIAVLAPAAVSVAAAESVAPATPGTLAAPESTTPPTATAPTVSGHLEGPPNRNPAENAATASTSAPASTLGQSGTRAQRPGSLPTQAQGTGPNATSAADSSAAHTAAARGTASSPDTATEATRPTVVPATAATTTATTTQAQPQKTAEGAAQNTAQARVAATDAPAVTASAVGSTATVSADSDATMDTSAEPPVSRLLNTRGHGEKYAASTAGLVVREGAPSKIDSVFVDDKLLTMEAREAGTRTAIPAATMTSSSQHTAQRAFESPVHQTASQIAAGGTETLSVDWKGWTNGGGERASTAAQFSHLGEKLSQVVATAVPAPVGAARVATSAPQATTPAAPATPVEVSEALAPIHSAIERLVLHGREQLSLTVRFEQGGSLSIKLAMNHGEIATQIQTDVPGLDAALKSAWNDLAQDWNSRGWKLSSPEISSSTPTYHQRDDATADGRQGQRQNRQQAEDTPSFGDRLFSPARLKHGRPSVTLSGLDALRAAALARRGIHTWA